MLARSKAYPRPVELRDLAAAFEHAPSGMAITDEGAVLLHTNAAFAAILGYGPEALIGQSMVDLTYPDDLSASLAQNRRLARGEISHFSIEKRYLHASGRPVWTRVHVSLLTHGGRRHHLLHVTDITHERSSATLLRESQERFREMTESVEQDFWLVQLAPLELVYSSPAAARIWGFDPMINRDDPARIVERILPEDVGTFLTLFDDSIEEPKEAEYRIVRADGAVRWLRTCVFPMRDASGSPARLGGLTEDVTLRKQAELEVANHRTFQRLVREHSAAFLDLPAERLRQGVEHALGDLARLFGAKRSAIFLMDDRTHMLESRYAWETDDAGASFSFTEYSFAADNPLRHDLLRDGHILCEDAASLPDAIADQRAKFIADGVRAFVAVPLLRQGQLLGVYGCSNEEPTIWTSETANRMRIAADLFSSAIERVRAVAAIRTHQEALAHALRVDTLGQLAAGIAHELNQPLASILNYAQGFEQRLASGNLNPDQLREGVRRITEQALRATDVIGTLRRLVRKGEATRSWHDVNELVRTALHLVESEATHAGTRLVTEFAKDLLPVQVDPIQIEQVVLNLVHNAVEAVRTLPDAGRREIRLATRPLAPGSVEISVADRGPGIDARRADAVFDDFYTTKPDGLGLGLSISRSIIEAHGGKLWLERSPIPGATFRFTLPVSA